MRTKHSLHLVWPSLLWLLLVAGCGLSKAAPPPPAPVTLRWITWENNSAAERAWITQFQSDHPAIHVEPQVQENWPQFYLTQAQPPHLLIHDVSYGLVEAIQKQQVADLSDLWTEAHFTAAYPAQLAALSAANGKQYMLPVAYGWEAIYYNKAIFAQYDLTPPENWEQFLSICDTLRANGVTPLALAAGGDSYTGLMWFDYLDLRLNGPEFHRALLAGQVPFDDERVRTVLATWRDLFARDYFAEMARTLNDAASINAVIRGDKGMLGRQKAAMVLTDTYAMRYLPSRFQAELDFFRFPVMNPALPVGEAIDVIGYLAPANAGDRPETITFLTYLASTEAQTILAQNKFQSESLFAPARTDLAADLLTPQQRKALTLVQMADAVVLPLLYGLPYELWSKFNLAYQSFTREPHDVERFLQKMEETRQQAVEEGQWLWPYQLN